MEASGRSALKGLIWGLAIAVAIRFLVIAQEPPHFYPADIAENAVYWGGFRPYRASPRPTRVAVICRFDNSKCSDVYAIGGNEARDTIVDGQRCDNDDHRCILRCMVNQIADDDLACPAVGLH